MKTNFLLPLVLLAATSCTSVKFAKAPDSLESGRAPANFQDDSLSNKSLTTIPEDCILADSRYISKNSTKHDLYYANPNKWSYAAENDTDIKPRIVVIKAACEAALQKNVTSISEKYFLTGTQLPFLPYAASSKRPYCGLSPSEDVCTAPTVAHPSYIFEVDQKSFPQDVENKVKSLSENIATGKKIDLWNLEDNITIVAVEFKRSPKSNFVMHFMDKATNVLTARGDVRFIILNKRESQPKADGPQGSQFQGDDWDVVYSYYTSKIDLTKSPDFSRFLKAHARSWDQDHRVEKWKIFYEGDYGNELAKEMEARARILANLWRSSETFLRSTSGEIRSDEVRSEEEIRLIDNFAEKFSKKIFPKVSAADWKKFDIDGLISHLTKVAIEYSSYYLAHSDDPDYIQGAAAIWWAARSIQLSAGCDLTTETPIREDLVSAQFEHQSCRRSYVGRAYVALNRSIALLGSLPIDSPYWAIATALGSRMERIRLYNVTIADAQKRILAGDNPSTKEVGQFLWQLILAAYELEQKKVLTWNGFQPASENDLTSVQGHVEALKLYFQTVTKQAGNTKWTDPNLAAAVDHIRQIWKHIFPDTKSRPDLSEPVLDVATEIAGLQDGLKNKPDRRGLMKIFDLSKHLIGKSPAKSSEVCGHWLNYLMVPENRTAFLTIVPEEASVFNDPFFFESCLSLLPYWAHLPAKQSFEPEQIEKYCETPDDTSKIKGLACATLALNTASSTSPDRARFFVKALSSQHIPAELYSHVYWAFADSLEKVMKKKKIKRKIKLAWMAAGADLAEVLSKELDRWYQNLPPTPEEFEKCYSSSQFGKFLEKEQYHASHSDVEIKKDCELSEFPVKDWFVKLLRIRSSTENNSNKWQNPFHFADTLTIYCSMSYRFSKIKAITESLATKAKTKTKLSYMKGILPYYKQREQGDPHRGVSNPVWQEYGNHRELNRFREQLQIGITEKKACPY